MRTVGINLICIRSNKLSGIGHVAKRYFMEMARFDLREFHFVIYKQKSVDASVFCIPENASYEIVNVPDLDGGAGLALFEQTLFYFYLKKCDVMWSPNYSSPWFGKRKKIISILDIYPLLNNKTYGALKRFIGYVLSFINAFASTEIVTISECSKNDIISVLKTKPEKIKLLPCFISTPEVERIQSFEETDSIELSGSCVKLKKPFFLAVSVIKPIKNYEGLISAFAKFHIKHPDYSLYIVGSKGWDYDKVFAMVEELGIQDSVIFTGYLSEKDINTLYEHCHATVLPSFYEGFGYTPLEGFYRGKISVASNISSIPEVVGDAGIYVDPYSVDSIAEGLEKSIGEILEYKKNIGEQIQKFDAHTITLKLLDLFKK